MPTAFETFVNDELPNRISTQESSNTANYFPRYTGTSKLTTERSPAQVLADIGAQASDADLTAIAGISASEGFLRKTAADTWAVHKSNLAAAVAPGATDDGAAGYSVGSIWIDTTADKSYICVDSTTSAAVWNDLTSGGGGASQLSDLTDVNTSTPTSGNVLRADGVDWESTTLASTDLSDGSSLLKNIVEDTTPQLGGTLDLNSLNRFFTDSSGNNVVLFSGDASGVNYLRFLSAVTGVGPQIKAGGTDTNVDLLLSGTGTGIIKANGVEIATISDTQTLSNKTLTTPTIGDLTNATHNHGNAAGGGQLDHGTALTGLGDDDHTIYLKADGTRNLTGDLLATTATELQFRATGNRVYSSAASTLDIDAATVNVGQAGDIVLGDSTLRVMRPQTDAKIDLGTSAFAYNDVYIDGDISATNTAGMKVGLSGEKVGFLGATPAVRRSHVADPTGGATIDSEARIAIDAILATLEAFGFHATV